MSAPASAPVARESAPSRSVGWAALALVVTACAVYANSFGTPFVFDDMPAIVENSSIRHLASLGDVLAPQRVGGLTVAGRPVVNLSLAFNYAVSGYDVWSYHGLNLAVHLAAALVLFGLVRRTLLIPMLQPRFGNAALPLAFASAALWALHPLQTASVTYIVQRAESLVGLFYLLTFYCFLRAATTKTPAWWSVAAAVCCALGMATKEVMVSAPLLVLLFDRMFLGGPWREAWALRGKLWLALASTWLLLAYLMLGTGNRGGTAGLGVGISSWHYLLTQCRAIMTYLGLAVWPHPLVFDYGLGLQRDWVAVLPQALFLLALCTGIVVLLWRRHPAGFLGAWFFAVLAPSSSFVPVVTQTMAEHRMYLPLAAVVVGAVLGVHQVLGRRTWWLSGGAALVCAGLTFSRNLDYRSDLAIWSDTAAKYPANARAHNNLGQALFRAGRVLESVGRYQEALRLQPNYPETHYNLGVSLAQLGDLPGATTHYEEALRIEPGYLAALNNLGNALMRAGRAPEALRHYEEALRRDPEFPQAHTNLGNALLQLGRAGEAVPCFQRALELQPTSAEAHYNLGNALAATDRMPAALGHFLDAVRLRPTYAEAQVNAGNALLQLGRAPEALAAYEKAVALNPRLADARFNLGSALLDLERWREAIPHLEQAVQLRPEWSDARRALGFALVRSGREADALAQAEAWLRAAPNDPVPRAALEELQRVMDGRRK